MKNNKTYGVYGVRELNTTKFVWYEDRFDTNHNFCGSTDSEEASGATFGTREEAEVALTERIAAAEETMENETELESEELSGWESIGVLARRILEDGAKQFDAGGGWTPATRANLVELRQDILSWSDTAVFTAEQTRDFIALCVWGRDH